MDDLTKSVNDIALETPETPETPSAPEPPKFPKCKFCRLEVNELALDKTKPKLFHLNCYIRIGQMSIDKCSADGVSEENSDAFEQFKHAHSVVTELVRLIEGSDFITADKL